MVGELGLCADEAYLLLLARLKNFSLFFPSPELFIFSFSFSFVYFFWDATCHTRPSKQLSSSLHGVHVWSPWRGVECVTRGPRGGCSGDLFIFRGPNPMLTPKLFSRFLEMVHARPEKAPHPAWFDPGPGFESEKKIETKMWFCFLAQVDQKVGWKLVKSPPGLSMWCLYNNVGDAT